MGQTRQTPPLTHKPCSLALPSASLLPPRHCWIGIESWAPTWVPLSCLSLHRDWQLHESRALVCLGSQ